MEGRVPPTPRPVRGGAKDLPISGHSPHHRLSGLAPPSTALRRWTGHGATDAGLPETGRSHQLDTALVLIGTAVPIVAVPVPVTGRVLVDVMGAVTGLVPVTALMMTTGDPTESGAWKVTGRAATGSTMAVGLG